MVTVKYKDKETYTEASGNGRLDAVSKAISSVIGDVYTLESYTEHALQGNSDAHAASYVSIRDKKNDKIIWGVGVDSDIIVSTINALVSAINRML